MIKAYIEKLIRTALPPDVDADVSFVVERPREASHGDFSSNIALVLAKRLKNNPLQIAQDLAVRIQERDAKKYFAQVEAVRPGFINLRLSTDCLRQVVGQVLRAADKFGTSDLGAGKKVVLEYSSPNTNKALHIGHFRNDTVGLAVRNLLASVGYEVVLTSLFNDRGQHICKAMLMYQKFGHGQTPASAQLKGDHFVGSFYARYEKELEKDPSLSDQVAQMLIKWEAGDPAVRALWKKLTAWVEEGFEQTYQREGTRFDDRIYESEIYQKGKEIVERYLRQGIFTKKPDGQVVVDLSKFGLGEKVLLRSDGTSIYITQDVYLGEAREKKYHPDQMLYCVGIDQRYHFQVLFAIYQLIGYQFAHRSHHLAYGYIFLGREKMSSRKGNVVSTDTFIDEMTEKARAVMRQSKIQVSQSDEAATAGHIALAAMKYGILRYELQKDIHFDPEITIQMTGDTGPYIQYTYARIQGIVRKSGLDKIDKSGTALSKPEELDLLRRLNRYPEIVEKAALSYSPNLLAEFLGDLSRSYNAFYNAWSVLKAETEALKQGRLGLCAATAQVLKNGLKILGIAVLEKM